MNIEFQTIGELFAVQEVAERQGLSFKSPITRRNTDFLADITFI
jgi:hypothetical protein